MAEDSLYREEMKDHYRSDEVAQQYDEAFSEEGSFRHRLVARRERRTVTTLLQQVPHDTVLDIPAGTGKLAPVFDRAGASVLACDVSPQMLRFARERYARREYADVQFVACDAESVASVLDERFDVAVCLRLFHRVPDDTKRAILAELAELADHVVVSVGITSPYHRYRRALRRRLLGGDDRPDWYITETEAQALFLDGFEIVDEAWILPWLSQEKLYLLAPEQ